MNMKTVVIAIGLLIILAMEAIVSYKGLDLRNWSSWLYGVINFLAGVVLGFALTSNLIESLKVGGLLAFLTLLAGVTRRRHKQKYNEEMARSLLLKYGREDDSSFFAKFVRKLLNKYK
jgi:uncharacterized membrane protein YfcA